MLLLHVMAILFPQRVRAVYVDHQLQQQSDSWGKFVLDICENLNISCVVEKVCVAQGNLEQQARNARYRVFEKIIKKDEVLVLAHHQQDQAETVLLRLLSGTGVSGLGGMHRLDVRQKMMIWRPFLNLSRQNIEVWVADCQIEFVTDITNFDEHYDRAWARKTLWSVLTQRFPKMQNALCRTAVLMQDADEILVEVIHNDFKQCITSNVLCIKTLNTLSQARIRQLLSFWLKNEYRPSLDHIESLKKEVIYARSDAKAHFYSKPFWYVRFQHKVYRLSEREYCAKNYDVIEKKQRFDIQHLALRSGIFEFVKHAPMGLCHHLLKEDLFLYVREGGERVHLYGRVGTWQLKKAIQEAQIFPWQRHQIQILKKDDVILGVFTPNGFWLAQSEYCQGNGWLPHLVSN